MKKFRRNITIALLGFLLAIPFSGCKVLDDVISKCDEPQYQIAQQSRDFLLSCHVEYYDNGENASDWPVIMEMEREFCEGDKDEFQKIDKNTVTDTQGFWNPSHLATYDYTNEKDRVLVKFIVGPYEFDFVYRWEDVFEESTIQKCHYLTLPKMEGSPDADFTANPTTVKPVWEGVDFTDLSLNNPTGWKWDFGDGKIGYEHHPTHWYEIPGVYTVSLTVTNAIGSDTKVKEDYITVVAGELAPIADFDVNMTSINVGQSIDFSDKSLNNPTSWQWDFGDGNTSLVQNPSHSYDNPGSYTVSLKAINDFGSGIETKEDYIVVQGVTTCEGFEYGGQSYSAVLIGDQCWMAENLNYEVGNSWCYNDSSIYCTIYGRLYDWETIMNGEQSSNSNPSGVQGICPPGWHLPSSAEWRELGNYLGGLEIAGGKLKEAGYAHWNVPNTDATNETGFTALPGGDHNNSGSHLHGYIGYFWTSTSYNTSSAQDWSLNYDSDNLYEWTSLRLYGLSVRCVKD